MTREQKRLVRDSFENVRGLADPLALLFFGKLFEMDPSSRKLFHNDLRLQGRKLLDMLTVVVDALDDFERIRPELVELGRRHVSYGVRAEQFDTLALALEWALAHAAPSDFDSETRAAWRAVFGLVSEAMKSAYPASAVL